MLKPRKQGVFQLKDWSYLQGLIDSNLDPTEFSSPSLTIKVSDFKMSKDDMISELKKSGYNVTDNDEFIVVT